MIVKDEEAQLARCLDSVHGIAHQLVVVDTGSTDRTVAIAASYGAKIVHHVWDGNFSAARNVSLDHAEGDWVLILDADERLTRGERVVAALAAADESVESFMLPLVNFVGERAYEEAVTAPSVRMFRNRPEYRFTRALHEQILMAIQAARPNGACVWLDAPIEHFGYLNAVVHDKDKIARNLTIARAEVERYPRDAFAWYNLGQEHFRLCQWDQAVFAYQQAFPNLESLAAGYAPALLKHLVVCLIHAGRPDEAIAVCDDAMEAYELFTDLWVLKALARMSQERFDEAVELLEIALDMGEVGGGFFISDEGVGSYKARWWLAQCHAQLGRLDAAAAAFVEALRSMAARQRYLPLPVEGLLQVWQAQQVTQDQMHARLAATVDLDQPRWRELCGRLAVDRGLPELAERLLDPACALHASTRLAHGLQRLRRGDVEGALACFAPIGPDDAAAVEADWHRLLARIVAGDLAAVKRQLEGSLADRGDADLVSIYRGLLQLWSGRAAAPVIQTARLAPLRQNLEGLLSLLLETERYELFGPAIEALSWLGLPVQDQAALLGLLYHHAGLLDSAYDALTLAAEAGHRGNEALQTLGLMCISRQDYPAAEALLGELLAKAPDEGLQGHQHRTVMVAYLTALQAQGREQEAEPLWQELLQQPTATR